MLSQCPCCGRGECGLLPPVPTPRPTTNDCLNALVAGGGSAGTKPRREWTPVHRLVSWPLLRAGECGRVTLPIAERRTRELSQCPCCGRGECGRATEVSCLVAGECRQCCGSCLNALVAGGGSAGGDSVDRPLAAGARTAQEAVSMPLLRAGGVRGSEGFRRGMCLNALVAGGGSAGRIAQSGPTAVSMPLLRAGGVRALATTVSMPLLRAGDARPGRSSGAHRLNALVAGGGSAGRGRRHLTLTLRACLNALVAGGGECGRVRPRSLSACLNALVAGGGSAAIFRARLRCLNALVAGGGSAAVVSHRGIPSSVSMPLLRAGGVRARRDERLNALVAGGGVRALWRTRDLPVSMPLLRAGGVRAPARPPAIACGARLTQCPCCGRGECGRYTYIT